ncbi:MAG: DNA-directed RNA polymerase subunit alpha C-terminal domain-containing protein, partial [Nodosilinea sp.]
ITPQQAMSQAADILVSLFMPLKDVTLEPKFDEEVKEEDPNNQIPIEELRLSVRAYNCLKRAQINSVADLLDFSQEDLLEIKNFGQKSAEEVIEALQERLGITLPLEKASKTA